MLYFVAPGHRDLLVGGLPLGPAGTAIVSAAVVLGVVFRLVRIDRRIFVAFAATSTLLLAARVTFGLASTPSGWTARYYANEHWAGSPERSSDFRSPGATRIDRRIDFDADTFPAHYLNDSAFDRGDRREVSEPMSIEWEGFCSLDVPATMRLTMTTRGQASVSLDGRILLRASSAPSATQTYEGETLLAAGMHDVVVRYLKPPEVAGLIRLRAVVDGDHAQTDLVVSPTPEKRRPSDRVRQAARINDALVLLLFALISGREVLRVWRGSGAAPQWIALGLFSLFGVQGWWSASRFAGRMVSFNALDDWFAYESRAREILTNSLLMTFGRPLGEGAPYFFHPFYSYFLAAVHLVTGETLFGPIFVQFLILAAVAVLMWRLSADLFGEMAATVAVVALVAIFEMDFARYYTVTLLTENLYILTVTLMLVPFVRWIRRGARADLVRTGFWCGVSTITRLPMMFYVLPALALIAFISVQRTRRAIPAIVSVCLAASAWALTIAPVTVRNWLVARRFVMIADVPARVLDLLQNLPSTVEASPYIAQFRGTMSSGLRVLAQVTWDHPLAMSAFHSRKLGFSLGMIQWFGGYRPHPELVGVSALYVGMCFASSRMRDRSVWPIHLFVVTHLASMIITIPWNYGYRLILPPFVYTTTLATAALASWLLSRSSNAAGRRGAVRAGA